MASIVVVGTNMLCNTLHRCYIAICLLIVGAIKYESIQFRCGVIEIGEGLAWRRFAVLVLFCSRFVALAIVSYSGFIMFVLGFLCHLGGFNMESEECRVSSLSIVKGEIF